MSFLIDSDIAIHLRDGDEAVSERVATLPGRIELSIATLIELQGGVAAASPLRERRRLGVASMTRRFPVLPLDHAIVEQYGAIILAKGFSRSRVFDRVIAATAIVHDLTLVTINGADFRDIPGLKLEIWPAPGQ